MPTNFKAEVLGKKQLTNNILELDLKLVEPDKIDFKAGQFVQLMVGPKDKREYSIITAPVMNGGISFVVNTSPMGPGSKYILALKAGDEVMLDGPYGIFVVRPQDADRDQLFVATGSGIAPFKSIISDLFGAGFAKKITLLFGVRTEADAFYFDFFEQLAKRRSNFEFIPCLSDPSPDWQGFRGRVTSYLEQHFEKY